MSQKESPEKSEDKSMNDLNVIINDKLTTLLKNQENHMNCNNIELVKIRGIENKMYTFIEPAIAKLLRCKSNENGNEEFKEFMKSTTEMFGDIFDKIRSIQYSIREMQRDIDYLKSAPNYTNQKGSTTPFQSNSDYGCHSFRKSNDFHMNSHPKSNTFFNIEATENISSSDDEKVSNDTSNVTKMLYMLNMSPCFMGDGPKPFSPQPPPYAKVMACEQEEDKATQKVDDENVQGPENEKDP